MVYYRIDNTVLVTPYWQYQILGSKLKLKLRIVINTKIVKA